MDGKSLRYWQPTPRERLQFDEYLRVINSAMDRLIGVVSQHGSLKGGPAGYTIDPHATGGTVVVRCPNCTWRNEVHPCAPLGSGSV